MPLKQPKRGIGRMWQKNGKNFFRKCTKIKNEITKLIEEIGYIKCFPTLLLKIKYIGVILIKTLLFPLKIFFMSLYSKISCKINKIGLNCVVKFDYGNFYCRNFSDFWNKCVKNYNIQDDDLNF